MNELQHKSLDANLDRFCKGLTDVELAALTIFLIYNCYSEKPDEIASRFIDEFFSFEEWDRNLSEEIKKSEYFSKVSRNTQELVRLVRIGLLEKSFHRFRDNLIKQSKTVPTTPSKKALSKQDKATLKEILEEQEAMLRYQLEDEDFIRNSVGDEDEGEDLVQTKQKQLEFLEKFGNLKFL